MCCTCASRYWFPKPLGYGHSLTTVERCGRESFAWSKWCFIFPLAADDSAVFWGVKYFNDMLMVAGPSGNVQSEILFAKGNEFTFNNGWAFPHRVYFNGDDCVLPAPQDYPTLPSHSPSLHARTPFLISLLAALGVSILGLIL